MENEPQTLWHEGGIEEVHTSSGVSGAETRERSRMPDLKVEGSRSTP